MAEVIAAGQLAESGKQAYSMVSEQIGAFRKYSAEVMARESTSYDLEKVFIQSIYGVGLFMVVKAGYHLYWVLKWADFQLRHPEELVYNYMANLSIFGPVLRTISWAWDQVTGDQPTDAEIEWRESVANDPINIAKPLMEDYWFFCMVGIVGVIMLLEKRRVDRLKRKAKLMMKTFEVK